MPDFNYGDFTQQGIENKVTLKARLNKRRYVTLDLQSDVEGPNLTISGNVHDELNNIDYPIGSAPNGNIEITENGENINVAPYATATVNVSGGDLTLATITVNASAGSYPPTRGIDGAIATEAEEGIPAASCRHSPKVTSGTNTFNVILYKGLASVRLPLKVVSMTGAIVNTADIYYDISGDCVLNVEPGDPAPPAI